MEGQRETRSGYFRLGPEGLPAGYPRVFSLRDTEEMFLLTRCQCLKEQWSLGQNIFPSFATVVDLHGVNSVKLGVKRKSDSFDTQKVRAAYQVLPVSSGTSSFAYSSPLRYAKQPGPRQLTSPARSPPAVSSTVGPGMSYLSDKGHQLLLQNTHHQSYRLSW